MRGGSGLGKQKHLCGWHSLEFDFGHSVWGTILVNKHRLFFGQSTQEVTSGKPKGRLKEEGG